MSKEERSHFLYCFKFVESYLQLCICTRPVRMLFFANAPYRMQLGEPLIPSE